MDISGRCQSHTESQEARAAKPYPYSIPFEGHVADGLPAARRQYATTRRAGAQAGAGEFIPVHKVSPARLRAAIDKVSDGPAYHAKAQHHKRRIAELDGVRRAADIAEEAFRTRRPVRRQEMSETTEGGRG
ncbi:hypothetical protein [Plantactinospora sp. BB1]|uniref:hypothetical protein n=1 Tax=Plantactinospora sp. BB1 TaxID=2071627 RepID=UPI00131F2354|nr:hypothetical protein [Plantactinospora sp. BB1]